MRMQPKFMCVIAGIVLGAGSTMAGPKENALHHFAQAIAAAKLCPRLSVNEKMIAAAAVFHDIDMKASEPALQEDIRSQMQEFSGKDPELACIAGLMLYGPTGTNVPGLLSE